MNLRRWIVLQLAIIVLFGPWLPATMEVARMGLPWMRHPTGFAFAMAGYAGSFVAAAVMVILIAVAFYHGWRRRDHRIALLVLLAVVPVLAPVIYGTFTTRYGMAALIGLSLLVAYGAASIGQWACIAVVLAACGGWIATSSPGHARYPGFTYKPDMRSAAGYVLAHAEPGDAVDLVLMQPIWQAFEHYIDGHPFPHVSDLQTSEFPRVWLAVSDPETAQSAPGFARFTVVSEHFYDGVVLFELQLQNPSTLPGVSSSPQLR